MTRDALQIALTELSERFRDLGREAVIAELAAEIERLRK